MMTSDSIVSKVENVAELLKDRMGVRGRDLASAVKHAGRLLPRRIRREAQVLIEAERLAQNPRLLKMVDFGSVDHAFRACVQYLETQDPVQRRLGTVLSILGGLALSLIVVFALVVVILLWRGYL